VAKKTLGQRTHRYDCGYIVERDHAATLVILQRGCRESRASRREAVACA
jgi:hypothetical protein